MNTITATQLRTDIPLLIEALNSGYRIDLIHRSQIIGEIGPKKKINYKTIDSSKLQMKIDKLKLPRLTLKEIDRRYRAAMMKKHGQGIS